MASIRLPHVLRKYAGDLDFVEVTAATLGDAVQAAIADHPDLEIRLVDTEGRLHPHLLLFVDGEQVARADAMALPVAGDARIDVLVSVVGGTST
ncbi:molybdopterin synthase sulfur carrier subunit [Actinomycetota bacterium]